MYVYIDESGSFTYPTDGGHSLCCVGALTIPESENDALIARFETLAKSWGLGKAEVKGRELCESQVAEIVALLQEFDVSLHVCGTDMQLNAPATVDAHRTAQARGITAKVTDEFHPSLVKQLQETSASLGALSDPLYVQLCLMNAAVEQHLRDVVVYYALTAPEELGSFRWVVDAKDRKRTTYEELWHLLVAVSIQSMGLKTGSFILVEGADYSHFDRFSEELDEWPDWLPKPDWQLPNRPPYHITRVDKIMRESVSFEDSKASPGLQLADVCVSAYRRGLIGSLRPPCWLYLGDLLLRSDAPSARWLALRAHSGNAGVVHRPWAERYKQMTSRARSALANTTKLASGRNGT